MANLGSNDTNLEGESLNVGAADVDRGGLSINDQQHTNWELIEKISIGTDQTLDENITIPNAFFGEQNRGFVKVFASMSADGDNALKARLNNDNDGVYDYVSIGSTGVSNTFGANEFQIVNTTQDSGIVAMFTISFARGRAGIMSNGSSRVVTNDMMLRGTYDTFSGSIDSLTLFSDDVINDAEIEVYGVVL